nr:hypothetical protein [uncultured Gellertiella sp.]
MHFPVLFIDYSPHPVSTRRKLPLQHASSDDSSLLIYPFGLEQQEKFIHLCIGLYFVIILTKTGKPVSDVPVSKPGPAALLRLVQSPDAALGIFD